MAMILLIFDQWKQLWHIFKNVKEQHIEVLSVRLFVVLMIDGISKHGFFVVEGDDRRDPGVGLGAGLQGVNDLCERFYDELSDINVLEQISYVDAKSEGFKSWPFIESDPVRPSPAQVVEAERQNAGRGGLQWMTKRLSR
jgi:hypothetical protein